MKKFKIEYLLYLFIIITPFLDAFSCLFRHFFPDASISPGTVLRPIIPLFLLIYVFLKDKKVRKYLFISSIIYVIYGAIHLYLFKQIETGISYGTIFTEAQYVINYTYMIFVLFLFIYFKNKSGLPFLKNALMIMLFNYMILIYLSIITGTSFSTYVEGMGYRGWFISGNSLGTVLILLLCFLVPFIFKEKKWYGYFLLLITGIYLVFLLGTRTGLFGFVLILSIYFILYFMKNKKIVFDLKKIFILLGLILLFGSLFLYFGSATLQRRKHLKNEEIGIIDINTGKVGHTTGDTSVIVNQINNNDVREEYLSKAQKKAYLEMYNFANKKKIASNNTRLQQFIYHTYLIKYQKNLFYILFGNGYVASYGEMILEMEIIAIIYNFGLIGFILYVLPFILIFIYVIRGKLHEKKLNNLETLMCLFGVLLAFGLSFMAGYVLFSVSCVLVIICLLSYVYKKEGRE